MSAGQFISLLEEQGLLDPEVIGELRRSTAESKGRITAESLSKLLVENGQLTRFQATRLISQLHEKQGVRETEDSTIAPSSPELADELDLLPENETQGNQPLEAIVIGAPVKADVVSPDDVFEIEDKSVEDDSRSFTDSHASFSSDSSYVKPVKIAAPQRNQWDAFRIWGVGFVLSVLIVALTWLVFWLMSGSASEFYTQAQQTYESGDYEVAIQQFTSYVSKYPKHDNASTAKVITVIAKIRQANEQLGDPAKAIEVAEAILPSIVNETGLSNTGIRSDLASALVKVGEKMLTRAESAKTTEDRKKLMEIMDRHLITMRNPQFIPNADRLTNEIRLKTIEEERARILRDIQRSEDLVVAVTKMKEALDKSDVNGAYQARREITRRYPQLETEGQLLDLQKKATELQRQAVKAASSSPTIVDLKSNASLGRSVLLFKQNITSKKNADSPSLDPETILFVKAKGSIYGLRGTDGQVLWRRYVGFENVSEPIRISNEARSDCLIVIPDRNVLARLSGQDGTSLWEIDFGAKIVHPQIDGNAIFVATTDGRVTAIDLETAQSKWSKQLPQKLNVGVAGSLNKPTRYVAGDHSNIYVLGRGDGVCNEVYFLGHSVGTIAVPPIHSLGLFFVFENYEAESSRIHIFKTNEQGAGIERCQAPVAMKGHITIPPSLDGRRLVVMTDLGETVAFDVEPASDKNKLNRVAGLEKNESRPRSAWPLVIGNDLWVASNRFAHFQIQVSGQRLVRDWVIEDEDQFVGKPSKIEEVIFHSRIVRGTEGVRVAATQAQTGKPLWEVDLGVPVIGVFVSPKNLSVVNSQAALFSIDSSALAAGKPLSAKENPGRNQRTMRFTHPVILGDSRVAYLNEKQGTQIAIFDPNAASGNQLLVSSLQISNGTPSGEAVATDEGVVIPLDNGQLVCVDPATGKQIAQPFQPTLAVGSKTTWVSPSILADKKTVVGATNQKTIYRLSVGKQLKELSQTTTDRPWKLRLAVASDVVCGVARGESQDSLEFYQGDDLKRIDGMDIDGRITWGPYALDNTFVAYSETAGLVAFDIAGKLLWKSEIGSTAMVGPPIREGEDMLVCGSNGTLFRIVVSSGKVRAQIFTGEPLSGSPVVFGSALLLPGAEGTLLAIPISKTLSSNSEDSL
jgi:outer membrane protein assembly factor BamB/TolA-binding protein